jgi:hypothetical protein
LSDSRITRLSKGECSPRDAAGAMLLVNFIVGGIRAALPAPLKKPAGTKTSTTPRRRLT